MKINLLIRQFFVTHEAGVPLLTRFPNLATLPNLFINLHLDGHFGVADYNPANPGSDK